MNRKLLHRLYYRFSFQCQRKDYLLLLMARAAEFSWYTKDSRMHVVIANHWGTLQDMLVDRAATEAVRRAGGARYA